MEINQSKRKFTGALEVFTVLVFLLSFVYLLDDVIQVLSLNGILEDVVFYVFIFGPLVIFPLSLICWKKFKLKRFGFYTALALFQILILIFFTYVLMNSQV